jgi:hypothetical protein
MSASINGVLLSKRIKRTCGCYFFVGKGHVPPRSCILFFLYTSHPKQNVAREIQAPSRPHLKKSACGDARLPQSCRCCLGFRIQGPQISWRDWISPANSSGKLKLSQAVRGQKQGIYSPSRVGPSAPELLIAQLQFLIICSTMMLTNRIANRILGAAVMIVACCDALPSQAVSPTALRTSPGGHQHLLRHNLGAQNRGELQERLRGGGAVQVWSPDQTFNAYFGGLAIGVAGVRLASRSSKSEAQGQNGKEATKSAGFLSLQRRFLAVFWLWKLADWLHGPYFYEVCIAC